MHTSIDSPTDTDNCSIEEAMATATGPVWFQLYVLKDRGFSASLVKRAEAAGCQAIVLTVDAPVLGKRERDLRNRFTLPEHGQLRAVPLHRLAI